MSDPFQGLTLATIQAIFPAEVQWLSDHRFELIERHPDWLLL
jgi:hypothetical protein